MTEIKTGYVTILGLPNAGKSTLMNALLGQKISITTSKPQTTRKRILGILSEENYQIIFLDTPGILKPNYLLQEKMMEIVKYSSRDADIIIIIIDIDEDPNGERLLKDEFVDDFLKKNTKPKIILLNKIDLSNQEALKEAISRLEELNIFTKIIPISASIGINVASVKETIIELLPEGPKFFPDDIVADESERFFVSEIIREKVLELYQEEIPYSSEIIVTEFREQEDRKDFIGAEIYVERDTQKAIIIGRKGSAIKRLGQAARKSIEEFLQRPVYLELHVKVKKNWRGDENMLRGFGYSRDSES